MYRETLNEYMASYEEQEAGRLCCFVNEDSSGLSFDFAFEISVGTDRYSFSL